MSEQSAGSAARQPSDAGTRAERGYESARRFGPLLALTAVFVLSRVLYRAAGVRFDASPLSYFWQYLDPDLLRTAFCQSLFYLHSQPPLMNLYAGVVIKLFPAGAATAFWWGYAALGLALAYGLYLALRVTGVGRLLALVLAAGFAVSPACALYENWLFYAYPVTVALVWMVFFCARFLGTGSLRYGFGMMFAAAALAMTWSLFHLLWFVAVVAFVLVARRCAWRAALATAALPLAMVCLWYGKNFVLFGSFAASTWAGMNFARITTEKLSVVERRQLHDAGTISDVSMVPPFSSLDDYPRSLAQAVVTGIPALDERKKPSGAPNFNNLAYIAISRQAGRDAVNVVRARPVAFARGLAVAWPRFFRPAQDHVFLSENSGRVAAWVRLWDTVVSGRFVYDTSYPRLGDNPWRFYLRSLVNCGFFVLLAYLAVFWFGIVSIARRRWADAAGQARFFVWASICLLAFISNTVDAGENHRFRFMLDPLVLILVGALAQSLAAARRPKVARRTIP